MKHHFLKAQDWCIPNSKKLGKGGRRPTWISKELMEKLKWKKKFYRMWKRGLPTCWEYRSIFMACRDETRKANGPLGIKSGKSSRVTRKAFCSMSIVKGGLGKILVHY